jgi:hypothetical protein
MAGLARPTLRCLREDLAPTVPRADSPLEEISHPLLAKANERFADDQSPHERIAAIGTQSSLLSGRPCIEAATTRAICDRVSCSRGDTARHRGPMPSVRTGQPSSGLEAQ